MDNELGIYVLMIKRLFSWEYGKERLFYNDGEWYDRRAGRVISLEELKDEFNEIMGYLYKIDECDTVNSLENTEVEKVEEESPSKSNEAIQSMLASLAQEVAKLNREVLELQADKANREDIEKFAETALNAELLAKKATEKDDDMAELCRIFLRILKREADE